MIEIKEVQYKEYNCESTDEAVCPYCGHENEIESESYTQEGVQETTECGSCERTFMYSNSYHVTVDTEPFENYYLREKGELQNKLERYGAMIAGGYWDGLIEDVKRQIASLDQQAERILASQGERNG